MKKSLLPNSVSGLLETAIEDARSLDRKAYLPHYGEWHSMNDQGRCEICLAGSVLAGTLDYEPGHQVLTYNLELEVQTKIDALNSMRTGDWSSAFEVMHRHPPSQLLLDQLHALPVPAHSEFVGWRNFSAHIRSLERIVPRLRRIETAFSDELSRS